MTNTGFRMECAEVRQGAFRRFWNWWMRTAEVIGNFQSRVVLTVLYVIVALPFGLGARLFSNRLHLRGRRTSGWSAFVPRAETVEEAGKQ